MSDWWTIEERRGLILSVGGGRHERPLSPLQVAELMDRAITRGASQRAIADELHLDATSMVGRFLSVLRLPGQLRDLVGWGRLDHGINLTQAQEIARLKSEVDQLSLGDSVMEEGLTATEARSVVQLVKGAGDPLPRALEKTLALRPVFERRYVTIGQIHDAAVRERLRGMSAPERSSLIGRVIPFDARSASLLPSHFTVVTDAAVGMSADELEARVNGGLKEAFGGTG